VKTKQMTEILAVLKVSTGKVMIQATEITGDAIWNQDW
jgi:hypothetical protein